MECTVDLKMAIKLAQNWGIYSPFKPFFVFVFFFALRVFIL